MKQYGVEIKSTSEYFEDTPAGRFMENIIANVAQFDNDVRAERSIGGMKDAVREGRYVWLAPYGYSNVRVSGKATIAPNHLAPLVRKAFEEITLNIRPIEEIRKQLITEGMVNPAGNPLSKSNFFKLIKNELYTGWISKFGERHKGVFEPIISEELFNQIQKFTFAKRKIIANYKVQNLDFPLRRFIRHPSGKMLTGSWSKGRKKKYAYYNIQIFNVNIRKDILEQSFKNLLNRFTIDICHFEKLRSFVKKHLDKGLENRKENSGTLQKQIDKLKTKQAMLLEKNIEGIISNELCRERIAEIDTQIYNIRKAILSLNAPVQNFSHLLSTIRDVLLNPGEAWEKARFHENIKLQWFYFPDGIEYDGIKTRTKKICKLFKLKEEFSAYLSQVVHHPNSSANTSNLQITLLEDLTLDITDSNDPDKRKLYF